MKDKNFKKLFLQEEENINVNMSEELKLTAIQPAPAQNVTPVKRRSFKKFFMPVFAAAACLLAVLCVMIINPFATADGYLTAYAIEINPAISIVTDNNDEVINLYSLNEDADEILSDASFDDIVGEKLDTAIDKIIEVVADKGILNDYQNKIRIYALNDDKNLMDKKLNRLGNIVEEKLQKYGHGDIGLEKREMTPDEFGEKMEIDGDFKKLDDMKGDIERRDKYKGTPPPPDGNNPPPKPQGDNPTGEGEPQQPDGNNPPPKPQGDNPTGGNNPPLSALTETEYAIFMQYENFSVLAEKFFCFCK